MFKFPLREGTDEINFYSRSCYDNNTQHNGGSNSNWFFYYVFYKAFIFHSHIVLFNFAGSGASRNSLTARYTIIIF